MDKAYLRGQLQTVKNNFAMVQLGVALMAEPDALERFDRTLRVVCENPEVESFAYIRYIYKNDELLKLATKQFRNSVLRNCLKEAFELVKAYGDNTGQAKIVKVAPWYQFLRIVRNCLSHDMMLHFNKNDLQQLPVTWSGLTIGVAMQDQALEMQGFLSRPKAVQLLNDIIEYVEQHLC